MINKRFFRSLILLLLVISPFILVAEDADLLTSGFIEERGQLKTFDNLKYYWQDEKINIYFLSDRVVFITEEVTYQDNEASLRAKLNGDENLAIKLSAQTTARRFDLRFIDNNVDADVSGLNQMKHVNDYYLGHCPEGVLNVPAFEKVLYTDIYENIDLLFYFNDTILKYEFIVNQGGNIEDIKLNWEGVSDLKIENNLIKFNVGAYCFTDLEPVSFDSEGNVIKTSYLLNGNTISFDYSSSSIEDIRIVDPGIVWSSSLEYNGYGTWGGMLANSKGDFYIVDWEWSPGGTDVSNFLSAAGSSILYSSDLTNNDIIIAKFDQNGTLSWACRYGGTGDDDVSGGIALDDNDNLFIAGTSTKNSALTFGNLPLQNWTGAFYQAWDGSLSTGTRGYLLKFLANNTRQWATYLDRGANLEVFDIAIGQSNSVYMTGKSGGSPTRITTSSIPSGTGWSGNLNGTTTATSFIMQFNSSGALYWATWLPGSTASTITGRCSDIAVDKSTGNVFIAGDEMWSSSTRFSTSLISASYSNLGQNDLFYMMFNSSNQPVIAYGKYLGGAGFDKINIGSANGDIELDESGNLYMTGHTYSANFPTVDPGGCAYYDGTISDGTGITANVCSTQDGYLFKVNSSGNRTYSTFIGGTAYTSMKMLKCDSQGNLWCCGTQNNTGLAAISHTDYYNQTFAGTSGNILLFQLRNDDYMDWLSYYGFSAGYSGYSGFDINEPSANNVDLHLAGKFTGMVNNGAGYQYTSASLCTGAVKFNHILSVHEPDGITPTMTDVCNISSLAVTGTLPSGTTWTWYSGSCESTVVGTGTSISVSPATTTTYYVNAAATCFVSNCISYTVNIYNSGVAEGSWIGSYSTDWNDCRNWGQGRVPDNTVDVTIPAGCTYYPQLTAGHFYVNSVTGTYKCQSLIIQNGASVSTTTASVDMHVYGDVAVQTGGTLSLYDDLDVHSGGNIYVTGGIITNNQNSGAYGDLFFRDGSGGYMTSGSITFYNEARWYENTTWYASGGDFHCGGTTDMVSVEIDDNSVYLQNFFIDAGVITQLVDCAYELDINASCYIYGKMETDGYDADVEYSTYIYSNGELEVNGAGTLWSTDGIYVGTSSSTEGLLDINEGVLQNDVGSLYVYGMVDMDGGTLDNNYYMYIYNGGQYLQDAGTMDTYYDMRIYDGNGTLVDFAGGTSSVGTSISDYCLRVGYSGSGSGETRVSGGDVHTDHMRVYSGGLFNMTSGTFAASSLSDFNSGLGTGYGGVDVDGIANVSGGTVNVPADWENWGGTSTFSGTADININGHLFNRPSYNSILNIQASADVECGSIPNYQGAINQSGGTINNSGYYFEQRESYDGGHFYGSGGIIIFHGSSYIDIDHDDDYFYNVWINGTRDIGDGSDSYSQVMDINGDLTIAGFFYSNGRDIEIAGDWTCAGQFMHDNNLVTFDGNETQSVRAGMNPFNDILIINTASGINDLDLTHSMDVDGNANFTNGVINFSGTGSLTYGSTASSNVGNVNSYVNGVVTKTGTSLFNFALGEGINWGPCAIEAPASVSNITAEYNNEAGPFNWSTIYMCSGSGLHHTSGYEHWELTSNAAYPAVTLFWNSTSSGITDIPDLEVTHYNGSCWENMGGTASGNSNAGQITSNIPFLSYSPITFGTKILGNSLPVDLVFFEAKCIGKKAELSWQTLSEINNDYFIIEKLVDYDVFYEIARLEGAGNSNKQIDYVFMDEELLSGDNYYRLTQVDFNGQKTLHEVISLNCSETEYFNPSIYAYPNPFICELNVVIENINTDNLVLEIFDALGKLVYYKKYQVAEDSFMTVLNIEDYKSAVYNLKCTTDNEVLNLKVVRK